MKYRNSILLFIFCVMFGAALPLEAQVTVSGTVTDAKSGVPLIGVNILVKGTQQGTITDTQGYYSLSVPSPQDTLIFSYIGYKELSIPVNGRAELDVKMSQNIQQLNNLVVIGYGTQKKKDKTGAITSVSAKEFDKGAVTSPQELIVGKVAGVSVTPNSGAPGSAVTIRIRGGSSLSASNAPLFVVDGVPLDGKGIAGIRNPLNTINPNDIKSISILKGASAAAIYGSRASNGVIIITTKKGQVGQPIRFNYVGKLSYNTIAKKVNVLSAKQFRNVIAQKYGPRGTKLLGTRLLDSTQTDWQDLIYHNTLSQHHYVSLSGAYKTFPWRVSLGFERNNGILKTSKMTRQTASIALNPKLFDDQLTINLNLKGTRVKNRFANRGAIGSAIIFDPTKPVKVDTSGAPYGNYFTWASNDSTHLPNGIAPANPMALLNQTHNKSVVYNSIGNVKFTYDLPFIPHLSAKLNLGYNYSKVGNGFGYGRYIVPGNAAFDYNHPKAPGTRRSYTEGKRDQVLNFYLTYDKSFQSIESQLNFTAGYSWEHHYREGTNYGTNYNRADTLVVFTNTSYRTELYLISFFGRLNYNLKQKYLLTATLRYDGTSRFSKENRWGVFPSAAFAWRISQEPFMQNANVVSQLKLRLGFGITGEQRINQGNYPYLATYTYSQPHAEYQFGNQFITTARPNGYNSNLKWEETTSYDVGVDYGFFNGRLNGSFDAYYRQTNNLLNVIPVPAGTNFTNRILANVGTLDIKGIEFSVTGRPISSKNGFFQISFNVSHNINEIKKLTTVKSADYLGVQVGGIAGGTGHTIQINSVGYPRQSFFVYKQVYDQNGNPIEGVYADLNGDGIINSLDKYRYHDPTPSWRLSLAPKVKYKNWTLSLLARANIGNYIYNNVASNYGHYSLMLGSNGYLTNTIAEITQTGFYKPHYLSDYYVENASFLKLSRVTLGYTFQQLVGKNSSLRISATLRNAFVITNYPGLDPEIFGGIDNNIYPIPRTFTLGVDFNF